MRFFGGKDEGEKRTDSPTVEAALPQGAPESGAPGGNGQLGGGVASRLASASGGNPGSPGSASDGSPAEKKKRGRPAVHGKYSKRLGSDGKHAVKTPGPQSVENRNDPVGGPPRVGLPADLVKKVVSVGLTSLENLAHNSIEAKGKFAGLTTVEIEPQLNQAKLGDARKSLVAELTPHALKEWGLDPALSPTIAIACILGPWSFGAASAFLTLSRLAKEKHDREFPPPEVENPKEEGKTNGAVGS